MAFYDDNMVKKFGSAQGAEARIVAAVAHANTLFKLPSLNTRVKITLVGQKHLPGKTWVATGADLGWASLNILYRFSDPVVARLLFHIPAPWARMPFQRAPPMHISSSGMKMMHLVRWALPTSHPPAQDFRITRQGLWSISRLTPKLEQ